MLTEEQAGTIQDTEENKLIIALPGSGKTYTFISLAENILASSHKHSVLLVTFTNAAANEMTQRLKKRLGQAVRKTKSSTFASLMMQQFKPLAKSRKPLIGAEQQLFIRRALISQHISIDDLTDWQSTIEEIGRHYPTPNTDSKILRVFNAYQNILAESNRYDINTMARELIDALISGRLRPLTFTHILVDEFQDCDSLQFKWLKCHFHLGITLAAVGDDDQSIYSWRGAKGYQAFTDFQECFNASAYLLSRCFRCSQAILSSAKNFIEHNEDRVHKEMISAVSEPGVVNKVVIPNNFISNYLENKEKSDHLDIQPHRKRKNTNSELKKLEKYRFVAQKIKELNEVNWAVLARTNKQLDMMERAFAELQIASVRIGGKSIFDNIHAVSMVNLFYAIVYDRSYNELVSALSWIGEKEQVLQYIQKHIQRLGFSAISPTQEHPWEPITSHLQEKSALALRCKTHDHANSFIKSWHKMMIRIIHHLNDKHQKLQLTMLDIIVTMLNTMDGTLPIIAKQLKEKTQRTRNTANTDDARVVLSTMNSAKGLEFEQVWILDFEDKIVPMIKTSKSMVHNDISDPESAIEEERRLVYVAMTRAKYRLVISYGENSPSPFLDEIDGLEGGI